MQRKMELACLVCVITFFVNNCVIEPDIMESRNIVTAREMVYDGHWLVPTLNGELRLEKPPLPTWITALAEAICPDSLALQRGMAALAACLLVAYFWLFALRVLRTQPLAPTLILCTCYNVILMGRTASWDIYCHAFMMAGIYHLARALAASHVPWRHFMAAGVFTGLSIMSKGPVSLYGLFLPFVICYAWLYRPSMRGKWPAVAVMALVALALGSWWYVCVHLMEADALSAVVHKETGAWGNHNVRPWWYYWKFFLEAGVWCVLLLTAIFLPLADRRRRTSRRWLMALGWMLGSLVLLSLMPEKKSRYLLPLLIPASYVMGCLITWWRGSLRQPDTAPRSDRWLFRLNASLITLAVCLLPVAAWIFVVSPGYIGVGAWVVFILFILAVAAILLKATVSLRPSGLLGGVTLLFLVAECCALPALTNVINNPDMHSIAATRDMEELDDVPFCHIDTVPLRIEIVYAAHRTIRPVSPDSLQAHLPCVLLTHGPITEALPPRCLKGIRATSIDCYDDNHRPKSNRRYDECFIYHATLLQAADSIPRQHKQTTYYDN